MNHFVFVTGNPDKQEEIREIIMEQFTKDKFYGTSLSLHFYEPKEELEEIQSIDTSKVAIQKALDAGKMILADKEFMESLLPANNIYVMVDDTGLYSKTSPVNRKTYTGLGYPGALIKHFMDSVSGNKCEHICQQFGGSVAFAECSIGFHNILKNTVDCTCTTVEGYIPMEPMYQVGGDNFGWDPCFVPKRNTFDSYETGDKFYDFYTEVSYAQMTEKNQYSMRNGAIRRALDLISFDINIKQHPNPPKL